MKQPQFTRRVCPECHRDVPGLGWSKKHGMCVECAPASKYKSKRTVVDDISFASQKEARHYVELKLRMHAGEIRDLVLQPRFPIVVNAIRICTYVADFQYVEIKTGETIIEDVKGVRTEIYKIKCKLVQALYGIKIVEIV